MSRGGAGRGRSKRFFYARVAVLLAILASVLLYAWEDVRRRRARTAWDHTLEVAVVVLRVPGAAAPASDGATAALADRAPALGERLAAEMSRYRAGAPRPFRFHVVGPIDAPSPPPSPEGEGALDLARLAIDVARWTREVDARAGFEADAFDTRVYVDARAPTSPVRSVVEGRSEQGGRVGFVTASLDETMADLALFVVAHEVMHTLGATDKYDAAGRTTVPDGLAEPDRAPLYPQARADVMARDVVVAPGEERVPDTLDELGVGPATAREIRWLPGAE